MPLRQYRRRFSCNFFLNSVRTSNVCSLSLLAFYNGSTKSRSRFPQMQNNIIFIISSTYFGSVGILTWYSTYVSCLRQIWSSVSQKCTHCFDLEKIHEHEVITLQCMSRLWITVCVFISFIMFDFHKISNCYALDDYNRTIFCAFT